MGGAVAGRAGDGRRGKRGAAAAGGRLLRAQHGRLPGRRRAATLPRR
jgi:hypothetical protein